MKKTVIIILAILVVGGGFAYFLFFSKGDEKNRADAPVELYTYALEDYFVTNVKTAICCLKQTIVLVADDAKLEEFLTANQYIIRDAVLFRLRELTEEDIMSSDIQDKLRVELPKLVNKALNIDSIVSVYFSDFVMQ
jgi:flagellar basal body-associated protein FliL